MRLLAGILFAVAALAALPAQAAEGLTPGTGTTGIRYAPEGLSLPATDRWSSGYKQYGGVVWNANFATEAGWVNLGRFGNTNPTVSEDLNKGSGYFVDAVGLYPLARDFALLGRVGVVHGQLDRSYTNAGIGMGLKAGFGVQYEFSKSISLRGEWERYRFETLGAQPEKDLYSLGVSYRF
jgi:OOP family OmpA-OmpF porin